MNLDDKLSISSSWIPVKALRETAGIKDTQYKPLHRKAISSSSCSPDKNSISVEIKANSPTSDLIKFSTLHSRYNTATLHISPDPLDPCEKKYISNISRLNEEILILSTQLKQANETISALTNKLNENNSKHAMHLQSLHERHEQKIRRNKQDIENLLKEFNARSSSEELERVIREKSMEIEAQRREYQQKIEQMSQRFEKQIQAKEEQHKGQVKKLSEQFLGIVNGVKEKFFGEIEEIQERARMECENLQKWMEREEEGEMDDIQFAEGISAHPILKRYVRDSGESDLDLSLKSLINQINLENEGSIIDFVKG